jgi:protein-S-isoprenylcysteine O-methyltransferase Ste14
MYKDELVTQGSWLFARRSFLPFLILLFAVEPFLHSNWISRDFGPRADRFVDIACLMLALSGLALRIATVGCVPAGTSGRSTNQRRAAELNTTGIYSVMRHPLYTANFLIFIGLIADLSSVLMVVFAAVAFFFYYERIVLFEEQYLEKTYGQQFLDWAARTPAFFPRLKAWKTPSLPFSWRTALRREFHGLFLIGTVFFVLTELQSMLLDHLTLSNALQANRLWLGIFVFSTLVYLIVLTIKKKTTWLVVPGR